jgi:hypothetical protein
MPDASPGLGQQFELIVLVTRRESSDYAAIAMAPWQPVEPIAVAYGASSSEALAALSERLQDDERTFAGVAVDAPDRG